MLHFVSLPSEFVAMCRGLIGSVFIIFYLKIKGEKIDLVSIKNNLKYLVLSGISLGVNWAALFTAYRVSTVALGSLCNYMAPIILVLIAPILYKEKLTIKKGLCVLGAFIGIIFVSGIIESDVDINIQGIIYGFIACAGFVSLIIFNRKLKDITPYNKAVVQLLVSAITIAPYVIINNINTTLTINTTSIIVILIMGIVHTGIAYCFYFASINEIDTQTLAIFGYIEPVLSVITSFLLLNEPLSMYGMVGACLIIVSACLSEILK